MPFIWEYQRPLTKKRHRVPITLRRKSWVHWNIIQECWHTGNSQILLPLLLEIGPIWILSKSYSFKNVIHSIHLLQLTLFLSTLPCLIHTLHTHTHTHMWGGRGREREREIDSNRTSIYHALFPLWLITTCTIKQLVFIIFKNCKMKINWVIFPSCHRPLVIVRTDGHSPNPIN